MLAYVLLKSVFGGITALIAAEKGRKPIRWFFIGFLLDVIGIIIVLIFSRREIANRTPQDLGQHRS